MWAFSNFYSLKSAVSRTDCNLPSVGFCRESRVEGIMSRIEGKMSRVEGKCRGFKNVGIFLLFTKKETNKTKQNKTKTLKERK